MGEIQSGSFFFFSKLEGTFESLHLSTFSNPLKIKRYKHWRKKFVLCRYLNKLVWKCGSLGAIYQPMKQCTKRSISMRCCCLAALKNNAACFLRCIQEKRLQRELLAVSDSRSNELLFFLEPCFSEGKVTLRQRLSRDPKTFQRP